MKFRALSLSPLRRAVAVIAAGLIAVSSASVVTPACAAEEPDQILNASFDVARELYGDFSTAFSKHYKATAGKDVKVNLSFGGSSKQAKSILEGMQADVATMNQETDIATLADKDYVAKNWRTRLPDNAAPMTSTIAILVRKGNPKGIKDWADLVKPGVELVIPNPKTSGNGRYTYLAAWAYTLRSPGGDEAKAQAFVTTLFNNVVVLDIGGRGATTSFITKGQGDALLSFENELLLITKKTNPGQYEIVYPSVSILAELPVSVVDTVVDARGSRKLATAYVEYLWSPEGQRIAASHYYRPRNKEIAEENKELFASIPLVSVDDVFGGWPKAFKTHFGDGGLFDQVYKKK
ncbi:hypothetical protein DB346_06860 [Verrucomicrobia bacterium LW23]|nr:hypothetical protein DB346_06860 [Verrucomicrobia bacterium LW23]